MADVTMQATDIAPAELRAIPHWVLEIDKEPYGKNGQKSGWNDPESDFWMSFDEAWQLYQENPDEIDCVGFIAYRNPDFKDGQVIIGDLDCCRNPVTGEATPWAADILKRLNCWTAPSISKCGYRFAFFGKLPDGSNILSGRHGPQSDVSEDMKAHILEAKPYLKERLDRGEPVWNGFELFEHLKNTTFANSRLPEYPNEMPHLTKEQVAELIVSIPEDLIKAKNEGKQGTKGKRRVTSLPRLDIQKVIDVHTPGWHLDGEEWTGPHPTEGSSTGHNLRANLKTNVWSYWHNTPNGRPVGGGDAWTYIACELGQVDWVGAGSGSLSDADIIEAVKEEAARRKFFTREELGLEHDLEDALELIEYLTTKVAGDPSLPFEPRYIEALSIVREQKPHEYERIRAILKKEGVGVKRLEDAIARKNKQRKVEARKGISEPIAANGKPVIVTNDRQLPELTAEGLAAITKFNNPPRLFVRTGSLARIQVIEGQPVIETLTHSKLKGILARAAVFITKEGNRRHNSLPPSSMVEDLLTLGEWPGIPLLTGLTESPCIRPGGTVLSLPGYDPLTRLYYAPSDELKDLSIPGTPSQEDARKAAELILSELLIDFPFKDQASRANTLAAMLTIVTRPAIDGNVPLCLFDKPQAGTGASLLTEIISRITTGRAAKMMSAPESDEEWRKVITSTLLASPQLAVIDNVVGALASSELAKLLTSRIWMDRILGHSEMVALPVNTVLCATGNNITLRGDIARRTYWVRLDAEMARPWQREKFKHTLPIWAAEHRKDIITALLTICRAWFAAGCPMPRTVPKAMGNFEDWSTKLAGVLGFAGVDGFLGNTEALYESIDPEAELWEAFIMAWYDLHGDEPVTAGQLKAELILSDEDYNDLQDAMPDELADASDKSTSVIGQILRKHADRVYTCGLKLVGSPDRHSKGIEWRVMRTKPAEDRPATPGTAEDTSNPGTKKGNLTHLITDKEHSLGERELAGIPVDGKRPPHPPQTPADDPSDSGKFAEDEVDSVFSLTPDDVLIRQLRDHPKVVPVKTNGITAFRIGVALIDVIYKIKGFAEEQWIAHLQATGWERAIEGYSSTPIWFAPKAMVEQHFDNWAGIKLSFEGDPISIPGKTRVRFRVKFKTEQPSPEYPFHPEEVIYHEGDVADIPEQQAEKWISRGVAEAATYPEAQRLARA